MFDNYKYGQLLAETVPRKIESEKENNRVLKIIKNLMRRGAENLSPEETLLVLLSDLVEDFEKKAYPIEDIAPDKMLGFIIEEREMKQKDLLPVFRSEGIISEVLNGKRQINLCQAKELSQFLNVDVSLFF